MQAFHTIRAAEGFRGVFTGWSPTFFGYSVCRTTQQNFIEQSLIKTHHRPKEHSSMAVMSTSRNSTAISSDKSVLPNGKPLCTWSPVPPPSSSPTSPSAHSSPSRCACRLPFLLISEVLSAVFLQSSPRKVYPGKIPPSRKPVVKTRLFFFRNMLTVPTQSVQGSVPTLGTSDSVHYDEVCLVRDDRRDDLQQAAGPEVRL